jgi:glutamine synthetase
MSDRDTTLGRLESDEVSFVQLQFTDILGASKGVTIPATRLAEALDEGVWFDGSAVEGLARVAEHDLYLRPDIDTYAIVPWDSSRTTTWHASLSSGSSRRATRLTRWFPLTRAATSR